MGREVKRVPVDWDWPVGQTWQGYLMPDSLGETPCRPCDGSGYSPHARHLHDLWYGYAPFRPEDNGSTPLTPKTPAVRAFAERNVQRAPDFYGQGEAAVVREAMRLANMWNGQWSHHLNADDVAALVEDNRLWDFTRRWVKDEGWVPLDPPVVPTPEEVNMWHIASFGHDAINASTAVRARCERDGQEVLCSHCAGHGSMEAYPGQRAEAEAWERTEPPTGEGWQLWETVSEGSPISPVFATAEDLAQWLTTPAARRGAMREPMGIEAARRFVQAGWAPSLMGSASEGITSGAEWVGTH
jgi:hypothetical protein